MRSLVCVALAVMVWLGQGTSASAAEMPAKLKLLYLGDGGHHQPAVR